MKKLLGSGLTRSASLIFFLKSTQIENRLTVTRGERGGDYRRKGRQVYRNNYKGHMDNNEGGCKQGREVGKGGVVGRGGGRGLSLIHISEPTRPKR